MPASSVVSSNPDHADVAPSESLWYGETESSGNSLVKRVPPKHQPIVYAPNVDGNQ
jgi:hypothetical protein